MAAERQSSESFWTSSCETQREWGRNPCRSRTIVYGTKKRINDGEGVNKQADSSRKAVVKRMTSRKLSLEWHPASDVVPRMASRNLSRPTTVFRPLPDMHVCDSFALTHALFGRVDTPTRFVTSLTLCPARRSAESFTQLSLCGSILKYIMITPFSSMSETQIIGWVKQKPNNNCKQPEL